MEKIGFTQSGEDTKLSRENQTKENYNEAKTKVMASLKDYFRPEFLNRLDDIILFDILSKESIEKIVKIQIDIVIERLRSKDINLVISSEVLSFLSREGYNPQYGARPLKRLIQNKILTKIANIIISEGITKGGSINVDIKKDATSDEEFIFEVKKKKKGGVIARELSKMG
jgi:ATP-dependent Clp protease ATP-binding subunit ClpA